MTSGYAMITEHGVHLGVVILALVLGVVALARLGRGRRRVQNQVATKTRWAGWRHEEANATLEFALVLPVLLFLCLVLAQTTMLLGATPFVHYASFVGARTAIVRIPLDLPGEPGNYYAHGVGAEKHDAIHRAASMALLPISPNAGTGNAGTSGTNASGFPLAEAIAEMYERYGQEPPPWIHQLYGRSVYALVNTEVTVGREVAVDSRTIQYEVIDGDWFEAKDAIAVRVDHRYALTVPWANRIYADGGSGGGGEGGVSYWRLLSAQTRLTGAGVLGDLPPAPELPRLP